jgi:hypothetical protein
MYYDANNVKSYVGPPLQNILTQIAPAGIGSAAGYVAATGSETVNIPTLGDTFVNYVTIQNNYSAVSTNCCPRLFDYGTGTLLPSTLYTYAIVYKCESGYTHPNFMYQYDYNGATYVTEFGLHSTGQRTHLGGGWYWAWATFTTGATVNTLQSTGCFYYQYSTGVDKLTVAKAMMVKGDYTGLHPRYWPALNTTRSTTQAIVDLTGNSILTINSLTYASNTFSFTGASTNNITVSVSNASINAISRSWEAWVMPTTSQVTAGLFGHVLSGGCTYYCNGGVCIASSNYHFNWFDNTSYQFLDSGVAATSNIPVHVVGTYDASDTKCRIYINGVLKNTGAATNMNYGSAANLIQIGYLSASGNYFTGNINSIKHYYTKALTADEVAQNFNALRGRYGI